MTGYDDNLASPEIRDFISQRLLELRKRLLDSSRRNPLIHIQFRPTSTSVLRVVDELPDVLRFNLTNGKPMRLAPLPALEQELPDEQTNEFLDALYIAREEDEEYLAEVDKIDPASEKAEEKLIKIERTLKDRLRERLGLPPRQTKEDLSLTQHARNHGISPSYALPAPKEEHADGRHQDADIQTLMLPEKLIRVAKGILEKGRSFERETGVNVLHAAFGLLEWKDPAERANIVSPLLLLEIRIERKQSPRGAQFFISGMDKLFVNTTLALKLLAEHRLSLPEYVSGSVENYFAEIQDKAPIGWHWKVRREVAFGIFPSSKIAMYHDLDPEKRAISESQVVARLMASSGGGDGSYAEVYETDDPEVAKKVPFLILDADASQYSALVDVANGMNLSIEGPPGSGKSQSIVNLVAAALADGKKVLFVAEKLTALDVVKSRLEAAELGHFILPLQAGRGTREMIYDSIAGRLVLGHGNGKARTDFESRHGAIERRRAILQGYLDALASDFGRSGMTVYETIGHGIATAEIREELPKHVRRVRLERPENLGPEAIEAIVADATSFAERLGKIHRMPKLWLASNAAILSRDDAEDAGETAGQLADEMLSYESDLSASELAPLISATPFAVDMEEVETLLGTVATAADRIDRTLVEALTQHELRRAVQTLCGQIQERKTIVARLSRVLNDPEGWNLERRLKAARDFAAENGAVVSRMLHSDRLAEIERELARAAALTTLAKRLPGSWTRRSGQTLNDIRDRAQALTSFPETVMAVRYFDADRQSVQLAAELVERARSLAAELRQIRQGLPKADNHDADQLRGAAQAISSSGALRLLSGKFKSACSIYRSVLGGGADDDRITMARRLESYAAWLDKRRDFEADSRLKTAFGLLFKGISTDLALIGQAAEFHALCQEIAADDPEIQKSLEAGELSAVAEFAAAESAPDKTLADFEVYAVALSAARDKETGLLKEAEGHLALFKGRERLELEELEEIVALKIHESELNGRIVGSEVATFLGPRFAGTETRTDLLQFECTLAEALSRLPDPDLAISILRSGKAPKLLEQLKCFRARREQIENFASGLWTLLNLPEEMRSLAGLRERVADLREAAADSNALLDRAQLKRSEDTLRTQGFAVLVDWAIEQGDAFNPERLGPIVRAIIAKNMVDRAYELYGKALRGYDGQEFNRIRKEIAQKDRQLIQMSRRVIRDELLANARAPRGNNIGRKSSFTDMSLIINEMNKKRNRIGARELTRRAGRALLELKPCWMMSPLAVAQYLHEGIEFDLVVIDEASQMTPENAIGALSRAKQAVIVGDTKQLPPTSFFQRMLDDGDTDEDLREDSESILDMANIAFMPIRQLRWHYRSRHSGLIQFSNQWMYKGELTIFPSALEDDPNLGVELVEVPGVYKSRKNEIEARTVVAAAVHHMRTSPELSLGICTMNSDQKDLILDEFERERDRNPMVQAYIARWEAENDALEEFFIKNLETIQGDERDVMFVSTLYGPEAPGGRVLQRFGPINTIYGHRRLNVLFSRAKRKTVTFTSLKPADIVVDEGKNLGVQMFRAWLEYCKTGHIVEPRCHVGETESPFEDYVARQIEALGCTVVPQVGVAGFRIDLGVRHPDWPYGYILGVECDGATYHSSKSSRERDRLRQEVLEALGWKLHRIWSTDWFRNPRIEIETLRNAIEVALDNTKRSGVEPRQRFDAVDMLENVVHRAEELAQFPEETKQSTVDKSQPKDLPIELDQDDLFFRAGSQQPSGTPVPTFGAVKGPSEPVVRLGSNVKVENVSDGGKKLAFTLTEGINKPDEGLLGIHTPLGEALIEAQIGDLVEYRVGSYIKEVRVLDIC